MDLTWKEILLEASLLLFLQSQTLTVISCSAPTWRRQKLEKNRESEQARNHINTHRYHILTVVGKFHITDTKLVTNEGSFHAETGRIPNL